jgi:UDP-N-acetylglucosamine:LPS N-acetylglucosamine transferase
MAGGGTGGHVIPGLAVARELRAKRVRLTVHAKNQRAVTLYQLSGFRTSETLPDGRLVMFAECL